MAGSAKRFFGSNVGKDEITSKAIIRQSNATRSQSKTPDYVSGVSTTQDSLNTNGGVMLGPMGGMSQSLTISSGILDLTTNASGKTVKVRPIIFLNAETGTSDTLDAIECGGEEIFYQSIRVIGTVGDTFTITHNFGSATGTQREIMCPGDSNFTLSGDNVIDLQYDETINKYHIVGNSGAGGATSEPQLFTINTVTPQTEPTTTDIDCSLGNFFKITVDRDITMDFTNETASKQQTVFIAFVGRS